MRRPRACGASPATGPTFDAALELDLATVVPSLAGPRRPQDRVGLADLGANFREAYPQDGRGRTATPSRAPRHAPPFGHGSVVIAAITCCTNTSNPTVMVGAGLLARNAVARGLRVSPTVKTSLAPGLPAVTGYLEQAGLMEPLDAAGLRARGLRLHDLHRQLRAARRADRHRPSRTTTWSVAAVLSGNRNFEGRIHPLVRASYLASPPLVVAFALAGRVDIDLTTEPLGAGRDGRPVMLADIWPTPERDPDGHRATPSTRSCSGASTPACSRATSAGARCRSPSGDRYAWDETSTYIAQPPFFEGLTRGAGARSRDIEGARVLARPGRLGDHRPHLPAGSIRAWSPAGQWLQAHGVGPFEFNSYGARRGHHEVMMRGTFGNIRLRNALRRGQEGPYTRHLPDGEETFIYDAAMRYRDEGVPLVVLAGREYGTRLVARLGGQGHAPARRPRGHRGELRAHPPLQPRRAWACCRSSSCRARARRRSG